MRPFKSESWRSCKPKVITAVALKELNKRSYLQDKVVEKLLGVIMRFTLVETGFRLNYFLTVLFLKFFFMWHYRSLHAGSYYLIKEKQNELIELVYVAMLTDKCVLIEYQLPELRLRWFSKDDEIADVVEHLSEEHAQTYEALFKREHENLHADEWGSDDAISEEENVDQLWRTMGSSSSVWDTPEDDDDDDNNRLN